MIASAEKSARGTVRVGSRTLARSAPARSRRPTNAKISTIAVWRDRRRRPAGPASGHAPGLTDQMPTPTSVTGGSSFANVIASTSLTPGFTPRTFTAARPAKSATIRIARAAGAVAAGQSARPSRRSALATEATAKSRHQAVRHAGQEPDSGRRRRIRRRHTDRRSATRGCRRRRCGRQSAPSGRRKTMIGHRCGGAEAGRRRLPGRTDPAPIVTLMMLAVSWRAPIATHQPASGRRHHVARLYIIRQGHGALR